MIRLTMNVVLLLVALLGAWQAQTQSFSFAAVPPVNGSLLFSASASSASNIIFDHSGLNYMTLAQSTLGNGSQQTIVTMNQFNRTNPSLHSALPLTLSGNFVYLGGDSNDLACSVFYETVTSSFAPVYYNKASGNLRTYTPVPLNSFNNASFTLSELQTVWKVGSNCTLFMYKTATVFEIYRAPFDWLLIEKVLTPTQSANQSMLGISQDLVYGVWGYNLYYFDVGTQNYAPLKTFTVQTYYSVMTFGDRVIVLGAQTAPLDATRNTTNYNLYVLLRPPVGAMVQIAYFSFPGITQLSSSPSFKLLASRTLTKFLLLGNYGRAFLLAQAIDYTLRTNSTLIVQEQSRLTDTADGINFATETVLTDQFLVVKNVSKFSSGATVVEDGYQLAADQVVFLNRRDLSANSKEKSNFQQVYIDTTQTGQLFALQLYNTSTAGAFEVEREIYGNTLSCRKLVLPAPLPFSSFLVPASGVTVTTFASGLYWFLQTANGANLNLTRVKTDNTTASKLSKVELLLSNSQQLRYGSPTCLLFFSNTNLAWTLYHFDSANNNYVLSDTLTTLFTGLNISANSNYYISEACDRIHIDAYLFLKPSAGSFSQPPLSGSAASSASADPNVTAVLATNGTLFTHNSSTNTFDLLLTPNYTSSTFAAQTKVRTYGHQIVLAGVNSSHAWAYIVLCTNGVSTILQAFQKNGLTNGAGEFSAAVSPQLTKVLLKGTNFVQAFSVDWTANTVLAINTPHEPLANSQGVTYFLGESFIYARQTSVTSGSPAEFAYFLAGGLYPNQLLHRTLNSTLLFSEAIFQEDTRTHAFLMLESSISGTTDNSYEVEALELTRSEAGFDNAGLPFAGTTLTGILEVHLPGCTDGSCLACFNGYQVDLNMSICRPCGPGCLSCLELTPEVCLSCQKGSYLSSSQCLGCSASCAECSGSSVSCSACSAGSVLVNSSCQLCPSKCFSCSDPVTCITCQVGFTLAASNGNSSAACIACSLNCATCKQADINLCLSCSKGSRLEGGSCVPCPGNCLACFGNSCDICNNGYTLDLSGNCVPKCQLPCLTCLDGQPTFCTSCPRGTTASGGNCLFSPACNATGTCTDCGSVVGYYGVPSSTGLTCYRCPQLSNCVQCDISDVGRCSVCRDRFYVDALGVCNSCDVSCLSCSGPSTCSLCAPGYLLPPGLIEGQCQPCAPACGSCIGEPNNCLNCGNGFSKLGRSCRKSNGFRFSFLILGGNVAEVLGNVRGLHKGLLQLLETTNEQDIVFISIRAGSVAVSGSGQSGSPSSFYNGLSSGGIPGTSYSVGSVSVAVNGGPTYCPSCDNNSGGSESKAGMIAGIAVGAVVLVVVIVVVIVCIQRRRRASRQAQAAAVQQHVISSSSSDKEQIISNSYNHLQHPNDPHVVPEHL